MIRLGNIASKKGCSHTKSPQRIASALRGMPGSADDSNVGTSHRKRRRASPPHADRATGHERFLAGQIKKIVDHCSDERER